MGDFDPAFIQEPEHRPKPAVIEADGIPQIDLSPYITITSSPNTNPEAIHNLVDQIRDACKNWGFFQVINHGVPIDSREKIQLAAKRFFDQPTDEKRQVKRGEKNPFGYYDTEHTKNVRDWKEVFDFTVDAPAVMPVSYESDDEETVEYDNQWPQYPPELREACEEYVKEVQKLSFKLLALIALSLNLAEDRFEPFFKDHTTFVRLNHYPPCLAPDLALGVGRHKDAGALTVLAQDDVGGLEVKRKSDGEWIFVNPTPNAFIINVGDIIQVWSNDAYESVEHRVRVNFTRERFSIPFFMNPAHYTVVEPIAELTNEQNPAKYKAYNWGKFFVTRKYSNFKKLDVENIQIYHFKKSDERKIDDVVSRIENIVI
ncbi:protein LATERAL BRANCHING OXIDOREDUCTASE 1-like [Bidens hawaiensis]|uniref:protein LATERAL BRANCHING OXIDOREDUCTASE 1-like n=1 Tax=Bidens hawaiensis TaxID=980011 RepID=UPI0040495E4A